MSAEEKKPENANICEACGFKAKSRAGLLSHMRAKHAPKSESLEAPQPPKIDESPPDLQKALLAGVPPQYQGLARTYLELPERVKRLETMLAQLIQAIEKRSPEGGGSPGSLQGLGGLAPIAQVLSGIFGGGGSDIIPRKFQEQIVANLVANAMQPRDQMGDFLKGFDSALKTLMVLTRKKMPKIGEVFKEEKE